MKAYTGSICTPTALPVLILGNPPVAVLKEKNPGAYWVGGWVGPRAELDIVEKKNVILLGTSRKDL